MSWLSDLIFNNKKQQKSKESAKSRLQLVLIHDRESREGPDFLPQLKLDIIELSNLLQSCKKLFWVSKTW